MDGEKNTEIDIWSKQARVIRCLALAVAFCFTMPVSAKQPSDGTGATNGTVLFISCDNGLRCVRQPCPNIDTVVLPSGERLSGVTPDIDGLSPEDRTRLNDASALYHGSMVLEGTVGESGIVARRVVRDATSDEMRICRP